MRVLTLLRSNLNAIADIGDCEGESKNL